MAVTCSLGATQSCTPRAIQTRNCSHRSSALAPRSIATQGLSFKAWRTTHLSSAKRSRAPLSCRAIEKLNGEQLEVAVQARDKPLIVDFYATWCGPCVLMSQELEKVAAEYGDKIRVVKIDTDEEPDLSTQLMINGLPTLVFIGTGDKPALRTEGLLPAETIKQIIEEELLAPQQ